MGSSCCHAESPCGSVEERSGLLNDSKATGATGAVVGTFGPERDDDIGKMPDEAGMKVEVKVEAEQVKQGPEVGETEPNNTQGNGPLQEVVIPTLTPSPKKGSELKENSTRAQDGDKEEHPADGGQAEPPACTLNSLSKKAGWEVFTAEDAAPKEESPASVQDKLPDISSPPAEAVCPENNTETNITGEHIAVAAAHDNDDETGSKVATDSAEAESSGEFSEKSEELSAPNTQITACRSTSVSAVSQEMDTEPQSCAATEDAENGGSPVSKKVDPEVLKSHDVSESSSGSEPSGLNHSGEEQNSGNYVGEPETTALVDASESLKSNQDAEPDVECATTSSNEATSSEDIKQDVGEEVMLKGQDKDGDVPAAEENDEMEEEVASEVATTESETPAGNDAEIEEVTGKEEQLAESESTGVQAEEISVTEKEASAEDDLGNSEEDLYRGAEELSASHENKPGPQAVMETTLLKVEDRCSLAPAMDILSYSEREWKGNTAKSALIRKGYKEMSQKFNSLRRVRGDNYCALRATLFQVLSHSTQLPTWLQEEDITVVNAHLASWRHMTAG